MIVENLLVDAGSGSDFVHAGSGQPEFGEFPKSRFQDFLPREFRAMLAPRRAPLDSLRFSYTHFWLFQKMLSCCSWRSRYSTVNCAPGAFARARNQPNG